ncbi:MAG: prephenate dehydrogenase/arogenate dehydrogenase family protein [Thiotrichaceae bacterium]|nr:prephenate dehydrogenase/arogenate dehydrogenase family protein [Thiotrichaceae bacterium]
MIDRLCIFGVGLIGGSLAMGLRKAGLCQTIIGCSRSKNHLQRAQELGIIDDYSTNPAEAVKGADMVFLAVPLGAMHPILAQIKDHLAEQVIITDGGSAKQSVKEAAEAVFGSLPPRFILGHPIAGREKSGVEAAIDHLYQDRKIILTPVSDSDQTAIDKVTAMWEACGASVECLDVKVHDQILAATSHLPHILAYELVATLVDCEESDRVFNYAAGGFQDFTRIASSDPVMWRDICIENKTAVLNMIDLFENRLKNLKVMINHQDGDAIVEEFSLAKTARDKMLLSNRKHKDNNNKDNQ